MASKQGGNTGGTHTCQETLNRKNLVQECAQGGGCAGELSPRSVEDKQERVLAQGCLSRDVGELRTNSQR